MHIVARKGDIKMFNLLLEHGALANIENKEDKTALKLLEEFQRNQGKLIEDEQQKLITAKQKFESEGISSVQEETALIALTERKKELSLQKITIESLYHKSSRIDYQLSTSDPISALFKAVQEDNLDDVKRLLDKGTTPNIKDGNGINLLHKAIYNGNFEIAELLMDKGAMISEKNEMNDTALHVAVRENQTEIVAKILEKVVKKRYSLLKNNAGITPFDLAKDSKNLKMLGLLMPHFIDDIKNTNRTSFSNYDKNTVASCEKILNDEAMKEVFLNFKDENGQTIVHIANAKNLTDLINLFDKKCPDFNAQDKNGKTPKDLNAPSATPSGAGVGKGQGCQNSIS